MTILPTKRTSPSNSEETVDGNQQNVRPQCYILFTFVDFFAFNFNHRTKRTRECFIFCRINLLFIADLLVALQKLSIHRCILGIYR